MVGQFPVNAFQELSLRRTGLVIVSSMLLSIGDFSAIGCSSAHSHAQVYPPQRPGEEGLSAVTAPIGWHKVEAGAFSFFAPLGWEFHQLQGVDSYVGEFVGDGAVLRFDFGRYSSDCLKKATEPVYVIAHESIGGLPAKVASPRTPGHGFTGVYFPNAGRSNVLCLWGQDLTSTQQELVLKIFETIRFERTARLGFVLPPPPAKNVQ